MTKTKGKVTGVNGNMVSVQVDGAVSLNEVAYIKLGEKKLKSEIIRIRGNIAQLQVYEMTKGIKIGDMCCIPTIVFIFKRSFVCV